MDGIRVTQEQISIMISHARAEYPNEACGILAGRDSAVVRVYPMANVENNPVSYLMDPGEQFAVMKAMRLEGLALVGIYHSHTASRPYPSRKDREMAFYPEAVHLILSLEDWEEPEIRGFRIVEDAVSEVPLEITDSEKLFNAKCKVQNEK